MAAKSAEQILEKYFPAPDDLVDGKIKGVIVKAMEEYAKQSWEPFEKEPVNFLLVNALRHLNEQQMEALTLSLMERTQYGRLLDDGWISVKIYKPTEYGKYLIHRAGCKKTHFETWNGTGWAYNHNDITHWQPIPKDPKSPQQ